MSFGWVLFSLVCCEGCEVFSEQKRALMSKEKRSCRGVCSKLTPETRGSLESFTSWILVFEGPRGEGKPPLQPVPLKASVHVQPNFVFWESLTDPAGCRTTHSSWDSSRVSFAPPRRPGSRLHDLLSSCPALVIPAVPEPSVVLSESLQTLYLFTSGSFGWIPAAQLVLSLCGHTHPFFLTATG